MVETSGSAFPRLGAMYEFRSRKGGRCVARLRLGLAGQGRSAGKNKNASPRRRFFFARLPRVESNQILWILHKIQSTTPLPSIPSSFARAGERSIFFRLHWLYVRSCRYRTQPELAAHGVARQKFPENSGFAIAALVGRVIVVPTHEPP
jgi:hypothetical protein